MSRRRLVLVPATMVLLAWLTPVCAAQMPATGAVDALRDECKALDAKGDLNGAIAKCLEALALYQGAGDRKGEAGIELGLGWLYYRLQEYPKALEAYQKALEIQQELGDRPGEAATLGQIGFVYYLQGDSGQALTTFQQELALQQQLGDRAGEAGTLNSLGIVQASLKEYDQALTEFQQALSTSQAVGDKANQITALVGTANVYHARKEYSQALQSYLEALPLERELADRAREMVTLGSIATMYGSLLDYQQALAYRQQELPLRREQGDRAGEALALTSMGMAYKHLGQNDEAVTAELEALTIWRELGNQSWEAATLGSLGDAYQAKYNYQQALTAYQDAQRLQQALGDRPGEALSLSGVAGAYLDLAEYQEALESYQKGLAIQQELGDQVGQSKTLQNIGLAYDYLADYVSAQTYYEKALALKQAIGEHEGQAAVLGNLCVVHSELAEYEVALGLCAQAMDLASQRDDRQGQAVVLNSTGSIHRQQAQYSEALNDHLQALEIQRAIGDRPGEVATLGNIGLVYDELGEPEKALEYYQQSLGAQRSLGDRAGEAASLNNIAEAYDALGDYETARSTLQQALVIWTEIGDRRGQATGYNNLGGVYAAVGDSNQATAAYEQALAIRQEIGDRRGAAGTLNNLALLDYDRGDYVRAVDRLQQAQATAQEIGDRSLESVALDNISWVFEAQDRPEKALDYALWAIDGQESIHGALRADALKVSFAASISGYYAHASRLLLAQNRPEDAFTYSERGRARTLLTLLGNQQVDPKSSEDSALVQKEVEQRAQLVVAERKLEAVQSQPVGQRDPVAVQTLKVGLEKLRGQYADLLTQLELTNPEYASLVSVNPLTVTQVQAMLRERAPGETLLSYYVGDQQTAIFVLTGDEFHARVVPVGRDELRKLVESLLAEMKADPLLPDAWQMPAQALYGRLVEPVAGYLPKGDPLHPPRLVIVPHDVLHYLPFGLLAGAETPDGHAAPLLLEQYSVSYAPSVSSLPFILDKRKAGAGTMLAMANSDAPGAPHLANAAQEVRTVAGLYATEPVSPTESLFKAQAGKYSVVHVAAHSQYDAGDPLFSAILLQPDQGDDGRLETHEVLNLNMPQTDLVTLSACETHLGELSTGDEIVGLERAFLRAGVPSLLSTLWSVDDAATSAFMQRFYKHLRAGVPKAEAVRLAQLETRATWPDPYYWAGFVLVGDEGATRAAKAGSGLWLPLAVGAGGVALGGAAAVVVRSLRKRRTA